MLTTQQTFCKCLRYRRSPTGLGADVNGGGGSTMMPRSMKVALALASPLSTQLPIDFLGGKTPLRVAMEKGSSETAELLRRHGGQR